MWLTPGFASSFGVELGCLRQRASQAASHDHLFHTVLGLLDVQTSVYEPRFDLTQACRAGSRITPPADRSA
jgi:lipid A ethanolaminephosphotransferase